MPTKSNTILYREHGKRFESCQDRDFKSIVSNLQQEIPPSLYKIVAELLAFIYDLNNDYRSLSS